MTTTNKISKFYTLISVNDTPAAIFNHRTHIIYIKWGYELNDVDAGLPWNEAKELSIDYFYNKLEKIER